MTPEERLLFREFLQSIQGISALKEYLRPMENDSPDSLKLAQIVGPDYYLEAKNQDEVEAIKEDIKGDVPLACNGQSVGDLFDYLNAIGARLRSDVEEFIQNNYENITPELIFQEEKALQNEHIADLHLKTGLSKKQATQLAVFLNNVDQIEAGNAIHNEIVSALCQHPEIKKLELEKVKKLDEHAKQVVTKVVEDIKSGKDTSGMFFPYTDTEYFGVLTVENIVEMWDHGSLQPIDVNVNKLTKDDINKELLEGFSIKEKDGNQRVVKKSEEYLKEEDRKSEELENETLKLAEKRAMDLALNHKNIIAEVVCGTDEDDIEFYKECFDPETVPGLKDKLSGTKISQLDIAQYNQFEKEVFDMVNTSASNGDMAEREYDLTTIRHLLRYAAARQDGMFYEAFEYVLDDKKVEKSKTENKKYIDELDKIVKQSELFKAHLTDPVPTYEQTDGSYLNTYEKNKEQYVNKLNNSFDRLSEDRRNELIQEAEKLSKDHPYINGADIMKYYIRQENEILRLYHECVDPDDVDKSLGEINSTPFTLEAIGRGVGTKAKAYELEKQAEIERQTELERQAELEKQEIKPIENVGNELKKLGKKLEDAKTFVNSSEYKDIIKMLKVFDENAKIPHTKDLNANQLQAVQLFAIKDRVDAYITHKAKDGVKQNVYKKLAAVEELNKFLCKTIKELSPNKFSVGEKNQFDPNKVHENFLDGVENGDLKNRLDFEKQNGTFQERFNAIKGKFNTSIGEYKNVQDCMGRIICSAVNNGIDTKVLFTQKETFMTKPSTTGQPEKQQQKEGNAVGM